MNADAALRIARVLIANGLSKETALANPAIPEELRSVVAETLAQEEAIVLRPARIITADPTRSDWLRHMDRSVWHYWPALRDYLLSAKNWPESSVRSLDEATDHILGQLADPATEHFDLRGLVLGYVQSGKTANFTALIAKAADVGYRLIVVLSGLDNGLRRQTQIRLNRELAGYADNRSSAVPLPPMGKQWHQFTTEDLDGDFRPGNANHSALQGTQPVLLVVKKNGPVLRRLHAWLDAAPDEVRRTLPLLVIDDEADQASVDTRGSYQTEEQADEDYEAPAVINGLIRNLLHKFQRCAYVAYTATPFANILIPHDAIDPTVGNDLYPKDFIVDLPKPEGYFGAEELFGRQDLQTGEMISGIDAIRQVPDDDLRLLESGNIPPSLETALLDFVLAGAAKAFRGQGAAPVTMLIHISQRIAEQNHFWSLIDTRFGQLRDEWRYQREQGIRERLRVRWEAEFRPVTRAAFLDRDVPYEAVEKEIGPFFEAVTVRQINSATGETLDYEREPGLKAIAIGGNRLARGLTLEGLMISYFVRRTVMYDTLMQMGRWFGFRGGYEDLTRILTTAELVGWFSDLAAVEHELRQDIRRYEIEQITPLQVGARILEHPAMLVTSSLKSRFASTIVIDQSYNAQLVQTVKFPFRRKADLVSLLRENLQATQRFTERIQDPDEWQESGPLWRNVPVDLILTYLADYRVDQEVRSISLPLLRSYIEQQAEKSELTRWTVAINGRKRADPRLGTSELFVKGGIIRPISRTRLRSDPDSLGVITSPEDEVSNLRADELQRAEERAQQDHMTVNLAAREVRSPEEGLLMIYSISRFSGYDQVDSRSRRPISDDPADPIPYEVIGIAISFPRSANAKAVQGSYTVGTVGWRAE